MFAPGLENSFLKLRGNYKDSYLCEVNLFRIVLCVLLNLHSFTGNNGKVLL